MAIGPLVCASRLNGFRAGPMVKPLPILTRAVSRLQRHSVALVDGSLNRHGRRTAVATMHRALERGSTYVNTAPSYGDGNSENIFGEALQGRRDAVCLATKCPWAGNAESVTRSIEASLERLRTDQVDVMQFHGGTFTSEDVQHILHGGPLDALQRA